MCGCGGYRTRGCCAPGLLRCRRESAGFAASPQGGRTTHATPPAYPATTHREQHPSEHRAGGSWRCGCCRGVAGTWSGLSSACGFHVCSSGRSGIVGWLNSASRPRASILDCHAVHMTALRSGVTKMFMADQQPRSSGIACSSPCLQTNAPHNSQSPICAK